MASLQSFPCYRMYCWDCMTLPQYFGPVELLRNREVSASWWVLNSEKQLEKKGKLKSDNN